MKIFITGGTGFIGKKLADKLVSDNNTVILLSRVTPESTAPKKQGITFIRGDLSDINALRQGMNGCDRVFHLAAFAKPWSADPGEPYRINVEGTLNVFETALECGVKKVVYTSTAGTFGSSVSGSTLNEGYGHAGKYQTVYEKTKAEAEKIALDYCRKGLNVVIVNPTRVYGPGKLSKSNSLTRIFKSYIKGSWRIIPGNGRAIGNYVFIDDVVNGHILAAESGVEGERYILGGENLSFRELFAKIGEAAGKSRILLPLPPVVMKTFTGIAGLLNRLTGIPPFITKDWLDKYLNDSIISSEKAERDLGYVITPFSEGADKTIRWLRSSEAIEY